MQRDPKRNLRRATIVYWVLLFYIVAALVWWAVLLLQQNDEIFQLQKQAIASQNLPDHSFSDIEEQRKRNFAKYLGEGVFFMLMILIGAVFIYRSVRKQINVQQQQRNFLMAVTHELKTPIAVSRLNLETMLKYNLEENKKEKLLQMTLKENLRLDTLINNILIASQLDGDSYKISKEEISMSNLLNDVLQQFSGRYPDRIIDASVEEDVDITGDPILLKLLVSNLLENANKYSPKDKPLEILLEKKNEKVLLEVNDQGSGIPPDEKKNVFQKFYRIGNEETRRAQGTGLGLYLCKKIAEDHGGQIEIRDNLPHGSKFIVWIPDKN